MKKPTTLFVSAADAAKPCRKPTLNHVRYRGPATKDSPHGERRDRSVMYADEVYEVPNDRFYRRRIAKGDLKKVTGPAGPSYKPAPKEKPKHANQPTKSEAKKSEKKSSGKGSDR